jgi:hypothetical protein
LRRQQEQAEIARERSERTSATFRIHTVHGSTYTVTAARVRINGLMTEFMQADDCEHPLLMITTAHIVSISELGS